MPSTKPLPRIDADAAMIRELREACIEALASLQVARRRFRFDDGTIGLLQEVIAETRKVSR